MDTSNFHGGLHLSVLTLHICLTVYTVWHLALGMVVQFCPWMYKLVKQSLWMVNLVVCILCEDMLSVLFSLLDRELYSNNINGRVPEELGNLTNLVSLDLNFNNWTGHIPATLGKLSKLQFLYAHLSFILWLK